MSYFNSHAGPKYIPGFAFKKAKPKKTQFTAKVPLNLKVKLITIHYDFSFATDCSLVLVLFCMLISDKQILVIMRHGDLWVVKIIRYKIYHLSISLCVFQFKHILQLMICVLRNNTERNKYLIVTFQ